MGHTADTGSCQGDLYCILYVVLFKNERAELTKSLSPSTGQS